MGGLCSKICPCIFAEGVGVLGRPIRLPKETYAVPGTAVEIVATCKYDVTEDQVEWSRVVLSKGKEKEEKISGKDAKKKIGVPRVKDGKKIGLAIAVVWKSHLGYYRVRVTQGEGEEQVTYTAITKLVYDYNHWSDFQQLDEEGEGLITKECLIQTMCVTETYLTEKEIRKFVKNADCMKANKVNYNEYVRYMKYAERNSVLPPGRELELEGAQDKKEEGGGDDGEEKKEKKPKEKKEKKKPEGEE